MKKKITAILVLVATVLLSSCILSVGTFAADNVVYLKEGGSGDGKSDTSPLGNLLAAYNALGSAGGTIVICGEYDFNASMPDAASTSHFIEPAHTGLVTVTSKYGGKDYREASALYVTKGSRWGLNGPTTVENLNIRNGKADGTAKGNILLFTAQYNPIVIGEGVNVTEFKGGTLGNGVSVLGGYQDGFDKGADADAPLDLTANITIKSGTVLVGASSRQITKNFTDKSTINIEGGTITELYTGTINNAGRSGETTVNISGGKIQSKIWCMNASPNFNTGKVTVNITGGEFLYATVGSEQTAINGNAPVAPETAGNVTVNVIESMKASISAICNNGCTVNTYVDPSTPPPVVEPPKTGDSTFVIISAMSLAIAGAWVISKKSLVK